MAVGFLYSIAAERAASAGALSGVVFMPDQFDAASALPPGSTNDATDRALDEARRNGFTNGDPSTGAIVTPARVAGKPNQLRVTVSRNAPIFIMEIFGFRPYRVERSAVAEYLPPISLGQRGQQLGSTVSQLGSSGYYFMRHEGWQTDRGQGDAFTPNNDSGCVSCPSDDVHSISDARGTDGADPTLPARGGYNFRIIVPLGATAHVQVYNAAFAPDRANYCENWMVGFPQRACSPGGSYHLHEDDACCFNYDDSTTYSTMEYTLYKIDNPFIRRSDTKLTQMKVRPIDARNWNQPSNQYRDVNSGALMTQTYDGVTGAPTNMAIYHSWIDVSGYRGNVTEPNLVSYTRGPVTRALDPGIYRLRVDTLEYDGSNPPGNSSAHKAYAVRVTDASGTNPCATCSISGMNEMAIYTPISTVGGGTFQIPVFKLPPSYAGRTIDFDVYDAGDMSGSGSIYIGLADPRTGRLLDVSPRTASIWNLFQQRSNRGTPRATLMATPSIVEVLATDQGTFILDNWWAHFEVPIPSDYNPGDNPDNWWWSMQYRTTNGVTATDTITFAVSHRGSPVRLLP